MESNVKLDSVLTTHTLIMDMFDSSKIEGQGQ